MLGQELLAYLGHALGEGVLGHEGHLGEVEAAGGDGSSEDSDDEHRK